MGQLSQQLLTATWQV